MTNLMRQRREELGLTQKELAERLQMSETYINKIENETRNISVVLAIRIATALETKVEEIFFIN
ncbi:helix-turn-helix transcriptional regulator [Cytobacillus horneckiae]|uniref:helix-turn-helix transcriptional regulator n=1 Tax=Cytobacillus horneckiae TaxID=549687 RepID=UPI002040710F|nr:helix-turn-helix transcriptional regulator [Cytobacillus horneckiae]MCM3180196.1 helix-turn-helix transcriptional regulator [Cytobacillus horneckiae]